MSGSVRVIIYVSTQFHKMSRFYDLTLRGLSGGYLYIGGWGVGLKEEPHPPSLKSWGWSYPNFKAAVRQQFKKKQRQTPPPIPSPLPSPHIEEPQLPLSDIRWLFVCSGKVWIPASHELLMTHPHNCILRWGCLKPRPNLEFFFKWCIS